MKHLIIIAAFIFLVSTDNVFPQLIFQKEEYAARREKLMERIPDGLAILRGASITMGERTFHQYNNMMYFAGVEIPDVVLVIDGEKHESTLFFTINERTADGEGIPLELVRDPVAVTGIENYLPLEEFTPYLRKRMSNESVIYTPFSSEEFIGQCSGEKFRAFQRSVTNNEWDGRLSRELQFVENLKKEFPGSEVKDCSPFIYGLRKIKSPAEVDILRDAARAGVEAHKAVIKAASPGVEENVLAALFEYTCKINGAQGLSFPTIIMSAEHHAYGHYAQYDRTLEDGDFIILDAGPDVNYYDADISTTFPANGKFSEKQKEIYEFAFNVRDICQKNYRPGITLADVGLEVKKMLLEKGYDVNDRKYMGYFRHGGYNHGIGMAVHDRMDKFDSQNELLQPGFVFACDIMARADSVTSVRLEDTVVITENGCEVLSAGLPRSVKEIEEFMKK